MSSSLQASVPRQPEAVRARLMSAVVLTALAVSGLVCGRVTATVYESESVFFQALNPGFFTERFTGLSPNDPLNSPLAFTGPPPANQYAFSMSVEDGFFPFERTVDPLQIWLSTQTAREVVTITNTGESITGIGGHFFLTDFNGAVIPGTIRVSLPDSSFFDLVDQQPDDFWGVTDTTPFTSLTLEYRGLAENDAYVTLGSLSVGVVVVPEPSTLALGMVGVGSGAALTWRRCRRGNTRREPHRA